MNETSAFDHWVENFTFGMQTAVIIPGNLHRINITIISNGKNSVSQKL